MERVKVVDIDLRAITTVEDLDGYASMQGLVRFDGAPLGWVTVPVASGRCAEREIRKTIVRDLKLPIVRRLLIDKLAEPDRTGPLQVDDVFGLVQSPALDSALAYQPLVTVAVCTRDRPDDLRQCLAALRLLRYPHLDFVIVDNASTSDATARLVRDEYPEMRYVREPRPGLDWARNRAIVEARGEIVAYTDDDVIVDALWVTALVNVFQHPDVGSVTGLVVPYELETRAQILFERYGGFGRGFERRWFRDGPGIDGPATSYLGAGQFGTGANMAYRRSMFERIGMFDPALDVGTITNGGGDLEMFFRSLKEGYTLVYEPCAIVRHRHRREYEKLATQLASNGVALYSMWVSAWLHYPDERKAVLRIAIWWFWWWDIRRLFKSFLRPGSFPRDLILGELRSVPQGFTRYQQSRRIADGIARDTARYGPVATLTPRADANVTRSSRDVVTAVRTVDLSEPLQPLLDVTDSVAVRVFVTVSGAPIGDILIENQFETVSVERLRDAMAALMNYDLFRTGESQSRLDLWFEAHAALNEAIGPAADDSEQAPPARLADDVAVSIVVATFDRPDDLRRCLASLTGLPTRRPLDIVVVDNHPVSGYTPPVVGEFPAVRLVAEARAGVSYARNRGFAAATGEIIVSIDDDVTISPDWLERLLAPFASHHVAMVTGNVLPLELRTPAQRWFEVYGGLGRGYERREVGRDWFQSFRKRAVPTWELGGTANMAFRTHILADPRIGMLEETLGPGMPSGVGEDTYFFYKVLKADYTIVYEPSALVWHRHRDSMAALRRQIHNYSKGHASYHLTTLINDRDLRGFVDLLYRVPRWHVRALRQQLTHPIKGRRRYPLSLVLVAVWGHILGPYMLWKSRRLVDILGRSDPYVPPQQRPSVALGTPLTPVYDVVGVTAGE